MKLLSTRTSVNDIAKHKNQGKRGQEAYEQRQMWLLGTRTSVNDVAKHKNNGKSGS